MEKKLTDVNAVISPRVGDMRARPISGARVSECSQCQHAIWVSPSSDEKIKDGYILLCMQCASDALERDQPEKAHFQQGGTDNVIEIEAPTPAQIAEIARHMRGL